MTPDTARVFKGDTMIFSVSFTAPAKDGGHGGMALALSGDGATYDDGK